MKKTVLNITIAVALTVSVAVSILYAAYNKTENNQLQYRDSVEYQFIVTDDSITVYDGQRTVGTVKLQGQLDSLIIEDNQ